MPKTISRASVDDFKSSLHHYEPGADNKVDADSLQIIRNTLAAEKAATNRASIVKLCEAAIKRHEKAAASSTTEIVPEDESLEMDWQDARDILDKIKLHGRLFLAGQVLLGWKLTHLKDALGYSQGGDRKSKCQSGTLIGTWEEHLKAELGIAKRTAYRFCELYEAARKKLKRLGGQPRALELFNENPADLDSEALATLQKLVEKTTEGETQKNLLIELKLVKQPPKGARGGGGEEEEEYTDEQLAFDLVTPTIHSLAELRLAKEYKHALTLLPLHGDEETNAPGLLDIKNQLESALSEIDEAITTKA